MTNARNVSVIKTGMKYASFLMFYSIIISHISHILLFTFGDNKDDVLFIIIATIFYIGFALAFFAYYIFMVFRLFYVFEHSIYHMSDKSIYFHIGLLIISGFIFLIAIIFYEFLYEFTIYYICLSLMIILFVTGFSHLVYSFNTNLFALVLSKRRSMVHFPSPTMTLQSIDLNKINKQSSREIDDESPKTISTIESSSNVDRQSSQISVTTSFTDRQLVLLQTIIKHTVLGVIMILMIIIFIIITFISAGIGGDNGEIIFWWFQVICTCTVSFCVYMSFRMNHKYYQVFCSFCDSKFSNFCEILANQQIIGDELEMEMSNHKLAAVPEAVINQQKKTTSSSSSPGHHSSQPTQMQVELVLNEKKDLQQMDVLDEMEDDQNQNQPQVTETID